MTIPPQKNIDTANNIITLDSMNLSSNNESNNTYEYSYSDDDYYDDRCRLYTDRVCDECGKCYGTYSNSCSKGHG